DDVARNDPENVKQLDFYPRPEVPSGQWHNSWNFYHAKDPQKQANGQISKFFTTGNLNHELKVSFNYRQQIADSATGLPGDQVQGYESPFPSSSYATAAVTRGVRTVFKTEFWSGTIGDTLTVGNLTANFGVRYDLQRSKNLPGESFGNTSPVAIDPATGQSIL